MKLKKISIILLLVLVAWSCRKDEIIPDEVVETDRPYDALTDQIKPDKKEIRAAWIATVGNYDWPITKGDASTQKVELASQLTRCQNLNFNAVILQVRPVADAFYPSDLEPWSVYLTGVQGQDPGYDPMKFAIDESHKRGMEFHAWLNPYRIGSTSAILASSHVAVKNPSWVVTYNGVRYFNPGLPEVRAHLMAVVKDIITRYDVDAIHFDDYFYPSGAKSTSTPFGFDDKAAFEKYGNGKDVHTWRADNVNLMVAEVSQVIKANKPGVLFGISPSGRRENSIDLYADPFVWLDNKWVDYLAPQVYWEFGHATADYGKQAAFWNSNARGIPMVIGIAAYKFQDPAYPAYGTVGEIGRQIETVRQSANLCGCFYFRMKYLENNELYSFLKGKYEYKSLLPVMGRLIVPAVGMPEVALNGPVLSWKVTAGAVKYAVYLLERDKVNFKTFNANAIQISSDLQFVGLAGKSYFVTAVNSDNVESVRSPVFTIKK
ncbi:MAG: family 10 glycosylhydrolase [Bacteroidota bacterium]|nr:family 10 glycosylhydrolase [Bacteroidota bacterium]